MDRIAAARARLDEAATLARVARSAGPPCSDCRFFRLSGRCGNPAYATPSFAPAKGIYSEAYETAFETARADDGLCGPEALLFEAQPPMIPLAMGVWSGAKIGWVILMLGVIGSVALW